MPWRSVLGWSASQRKGFSGAWTVGGLLLLSLFLSAPSVQRFVIPDELAMATVTERVRNRLPIGIEEPLSDVAQGLIHPRSLTIVDGKVVPEGFFSIGILYGLLERFIPLPQIPWFVLLGSTLWAAQCLKKIVNWVGAPDVIARLSLIFYPILPPILYYTLHPYLANLLQLNLVLIAISSIIGIGSRYAVVSSAAIGVLLGTAIALRPVEALWIIPLISAILIAVRSLMSRSVLTSIILGASIPLLALAQIQHTVFGDWWSVGYASNPSLTESTGSAGPLALMLSALFPFGIHPTSIIHRVGQLVQLYWWWLPLVILGLPQWRGAARQRNYVLLAGILTIWILVYYGSWEFSEPEESGTFAMSTGFVRYFLPVWGVWLPILVSGILVMVHKIPQRARSGALLAIVCGFVLSPLVSGSGSIIHQFNEQKLYRTRLDRILSVTAPNAILLVKRSDKVYYPFRKVIVWYKEPKKVIATLPALLRHAPVYLDIVEQEGSTLVLPPSIAVEQRVVVSSSEQLWKLVSRPE